MPKEKYSFAPEILAHSRAIGRNYRPLRQRLLPDRGHRAWRWDEPCPALDRQHQPRRRDEGAFCDHGQRPAAPPETAGHSEGIESSRAHLPHQPLGLSSYTGGDSYGNLTRPEGQARRHHRHRRHGVQCVPHLGEGGQASSSSSSARPRPSTCATTSRDRSGVGASLPAARLAAEADGRISTSSCTGGHQDEDLVSDGWTDIIRNLTGPGDRRGFEARP